MQKENLIPPTLQTSRLLLRPVTSVDLASYQKNFNDYEIPDTWRPLCLGPIQRTQRMWDRVG